MNDTKFKHLNDEQLDDLKKLTDRMIDICLKSGVARDDIHKQLDDILAEQLKRL